MAKLIDLDELVKWLTSPTGFRTNCEDCNSTDCLNCIVEEGIKNQPIVEATPVVYGRWVSMGAYSGHKCGVCNDYFTDDASNLFYCPRCAAKMVEIEKIDYRRLGMPIGAPWVKTICEHGRREE